MTHAESISTDVVVIGGGAAGLMCAITAGKRGRSVTVLEGSNRVGKKILMSGGGRCNFTNLHIDSTRYLGGNPHFCKSALSRYTQWDFISLIENHEIAYHEKTLGQLFCDHTSKDVVAMLLAECEAAGVRIVTGSDVSSVQETSSGDSRTYQVESSDGLFHCESLVVASGGLSIPKMGASDFGYRLARQFGLKVLPTRAGLVPFTVTGEVHELCQRLSGVSCRAIVSARDSHFDEQILFTHRGLSGPAMLQVSSYWTPGDTIQINVLPDQTVSLLQSARDARPRTTLRTVLAEHLPKALTQELQNLFWSALSDIPLAEIGNDDLSAVMRSLQNWSVKPAATEGYRTAEVTLGGVDTDELSSKTMQCKRYPGLYFIGEVVDVTGHLGGFNFQWAWASGFAAGLAA